MIALENVSYSIKENGDRFEIIKNVSLQIDDGKLVVITGPNGGGKSTLAKLIMGILPVTEGRILFDDRDITTLSVTERAKLGISYAFQQPPRLKGITVRELINIASGREMPAFECCKYLTEVGLCSAKYLDRELDNSLSGGEMKRIEIATLLARKTKVAIYDEPEAGIDLWSFTRLTETFGEIHKNSDGIIIIISHQERILDLADEIIVVSEGTILKHGRKEEVLPTIMMEVGYSCGYEYKELSE